MTPERLVETVLRSKRNWGNEVIKLVKKDGLEWKTQYMVELDDSLERRFANLVESMECRNMWYVQPLSIENLREGLIGRHLDTPELTRVVNILEANPTFWLDLDGVEREEE